MESNHIIGEFEITVNSYAIYSVSILIFNKDKRCFVFVKQFRPGILYILRVISFKSCITFI